MGLFKSKIKKLSQTKTRNELKQGYERTEWKLTRAAQNGDKKTYGAAMKEHRVYEKAIYDQMFDEAKQIKKNNRRKKEMKSRKILGMVLSVMLIASACLSGCKFSDIADVGNNSADVGSSDVGTETPEKPEIENAVENGGSYAMPAKMAFTSDTLAAANETGVTVTLVATVEPADALDKSVDWSVNWSDDAALKESDITQYLTCTPETDGSTTATVQCKQPFGDDTIVITVTTRDGGYQANCMVTFVGIPTSMTIETDLPERTTDDFVKYREIGVNRTGSVTVKLDNAFHSVSEMYYQQLEISCKAPKVMVCDETQTTNGAGVTTSTQDNIHELDLNSVVSEFISLNVTGATFTLEANRKIETYYSSFRTSGRSIIYYDKFLRYLSSLEASPYFVVSVKLPGILSTSAGFNLQITSSVTGVSLDGALKI